MQLTQRHIIKSTEPRFAEIDLPSIQVQKSVQCRQLRHSSEFHLRMGLCRLQRDEPHHEVSGSIQSFAC